eukprot:s4125_g7.t1
MKKRRLFDISNTISRSLSIHFPAFVLHNFEYPFHKFDEIDTKSPKVQLGQLPLRHRCPSTRPPEEPNYEPSYAWLCCLQKLGNRWEWFVSEGFGHASEKSFHVLSDLSDYE